MANEAEAVIRRWFDEVWNQGREEVIDELFTRDGIAHGLAGGDLHGTEAFKPFYRQFRTAFPDIRVTVEHAVPDADTVAVRCSVSATHTGPGLLDTVTGKPVQFTGMCIARVKDGKIVESWNNFDFLALYQQLGMRLT